MRGDPVVFHLAVVEGWVRDPLLGWTRPGELGRIVCRDPNDTRRWLFCPEAWPYDRLIEEAPRFDTEGAALAAALGWVRAGCPERAGGSDATR